MAAILEPGAHPEHLPAVGLRHPLTHGAAPVGGLDATLAGADPVKAREDLQRAMTLGAGVVRSESSLSEVSRQLADAAAAVGAMATPAQAELGNLVTVARCLVDAAQARRESRGAHSRSDFPETAASQLVRYVH